MSTRIQFLRHLSCGPRGDMLTQLQTADFRSLRYNTTSNQRSRRNENSSTARNSPPNFCRFFRFPEDTHHELLLLSHGGLISDERRPIQMDLEYRKLLAPNGPHLIPPSDFRSPRLPRPPPGLEYLQTSPDSGDMEKTPPVTGTRRGGSRQACNECKQQKVSHMQIYPSPRLVFCTPKQHSSLRTQR